MKSTQVEKEESINLLKNMLKDGDTIYTSLAQVSASGMYRHIKPILIKDNEPLLLSYFVSKVLDYPYKNKTYAVGVGGCGMDMGFHLVNTLEHALNIKLKHRWI